jgi:hypothetical protein
MHTFSPCQLHAQVRYLPSPPRSTICPICLKAPRLPLLPPARLLNASELFLLTLAMSYNLPKIASVFVASKRGLYSCITVSATRYMALLFVPRLHPSSESPSGLPPRLSIPNMFGWILEGKLVAARKSSTCSLRRGTQLTAPNPSRQNGSAECPHQDIVIRFASYSLVPHWPSLLAVCVLSFTPTPRYVYSR